MEDEGQVDRWRVTFFPPMMSRITAWLSVIDVMLILMHSFIGDADQPGVRINRDGVYRK